MLAASLSLLALGASTQDRQTVPDLSLTIKDIYGGPLAPFQPTGQMASVLFFISQDCPISNRYAPEIVRLVQQYQPKKVQFVLVYVDPAASAKAITAHYREYGLSPIPAVQDTRHLLVTAVGASVTPEVAVVGSKGDLLYRGRIDNLYAALGKPRRQVTEHDLRNALDEVLQNGPVTVARTQAIGCYISKQN